MKFLENIKQGFKRTIYRNKCRSEKQHIQKNNNLNYLMFFQLQCISQILDHYLNQNRSHQHVRLQYVTIAQQNIANY